MIQPPPTGEGFRTRVKALLTEAGFKAESRKLVPGSDAVVVAESPYYVIAFQVFEDWPSLRTAAPQIEASLARLIGEHKGTGKLWDAYLVLACRSELDDPRQFNELSDLTYDTNKTRKIVRTGIGDSISNIDEVIEPFLPLKKARVRAKDRDPLAVLADKLATRGIARTQIDRLIRMFRERGGVING